ncbi:MAG: SRPBCC family protein [Burkholderiaceae bacterium]|nr:SRPBCC family protein [Burkholderiaceae bacterium]
MNKFVPHAATTGLLLIAGTCHAAGALSFSSEETVDSAPATVWKYVGDFNGFDLWHPQVRSSTVKGADNKVGAVRTLKLADGSELVEKLLKYNAASTSYTYTSLKSPFPIKNYVATISVSPAAGGKTLMKWSATFDAVNIDEDIATEMVAIALNGGLGKVVANFQKPAAPEGASTPTSAATSAIAP